MVPLPKAEGSIAVQSDGGTSATVTWARRIWDIRLVTWLWIRRSRQCLLIVGPAAVACYQNLVSVSDSVGGATALNCTIESSYSDSAKIRVWKAFRPAVRDERVSRCEDAFKGAWSYMTGAEVGNVNTAMQRWQCHRTQAAVSARFRPPRISYGCHARRLACNPAVSS